MRQSSASVPLHMAVGMRANAHRDGQCRGFSTQRQLAPVEYDVASNQFPSEFGPPSDDCTYDKPKRHSPKRGRRHGFGALHDLLMLRGPHNKHTCHHPLQKLHGEKVEPHGDKEFSQIYEA